jgi:acetyl-CoA carboxylase biotin carboxyl carrier protein
VTKTTKTKTAAKGGAKPPAAPSKAVQGKAPPGKAPPAPAKGPLSSAASDLVRQLATVLDETHLTEIEYESGGLRIRVARGTRDVFAGGFAPAPAAAPATAAAVAAAAEPVAVDPAHNPGTVKSPMVGVAYLAPEPGAPQFVKVGDTVTEGQTLLLVEAMKTFNPVKAHRAGKVSQILVETGAPVEYGEPLLIIS